VRIVSLEMRRRNLRVIVAGGSGRRTWGSICGGMCKGRCDLLLGVCTDIEVDGFGCVGDACSQKVVNGAIPRYRSPSTTVLIYFSTK
jgi:hypothetical protein